MRGDSKEPKLLVAWVLEVKNTMASDKPSKIMDCDESIQILHKGKDSIEPKIASVHGLTGNGLGT